MWTLLQKRFLIVVDGGTYIRPTSRTLVDLGYKAKALYYRAFNSFKFMLVTWSSVIPANQWGGQVRKLHIDLWTAISWNSCIEPLRQKPDKRIQEAPSPLVSGVLLPTSVKYTIVSDWLKYTASNWQKFYEVGLDLLTSRAFKRVARQCRVLPHQTRKPSERLWESLEVGCTLYDGLYRRLCPKGVPFSGSKCKKQKG